MTFLAHKEKLKVFTVIKSLAGKRVGWLPKASASLYYVRAAIQYTVKSI